MPWSHGHPMGLFSSCPNWGWCQHVGPGPLAPSCLVYKTGFMDAPRRLRARGPLGAQSTFEMQCTPPRSSQGSNINPQMIKCPQLTVAAEMP